MNTILRYKLALFALLFAALTTISFSRFLDGIGDADGEDPSASPAEAVVVLTGGIGRMEEGLRLFGSGRGKVLIISGVEAKNGIEQIFPGRQLKELVDSSRIILEIKSRSTLENALHVREIIRERNIGSIILVTSNYHMARAHALFSDALGSEVLIHRHPVKGPNFKRRWWTDVNSINLIVGEYLKFLGFHIWQRWLV